MVIENGEGSKVNGENMIVDQDNDNDSDDNAEDIALDEVQATKKVKTGKSQLRQSNKTRKVKADKDRKPACEICFQSLDDDLRLYNGHPNDALDEYSIVLHPKLCLFTGNEEDLDQTDFRAFNKVTHFSVYDKNGHLVPFDSGLIERNVLIYFSGYVKAIYEDDPSIESAIPGMDMGPIVEWAVSGFDGGEQPIITFTTEIGEYALMEPSEEYAPFMVSVREKTFMSKTVIEFLCDEDFPSYEDLLNKLSTVVMPKGLPRFTEDILLHHAQFICDQVMSFDEAATDGEDLLITTPCMRALIDLAGITFKKGKTIRKNKKFISRRQEEEWRNGLIRKAQKDKKAGWTKATTTPLVNKVFDNFFPDQIANNNDPKGLKRMRCGYCEHCQCADCGDCVNCKSMIKFGGAGRSKQACIKRRCPNMEIQQANDNEQDDQENASLHAESSLDIHKRMTSKPCKSRTNKMNWVGKPIASDSKGTFYNSVDIDHNCRVSVGDCVFIEPMDPVIPLHIVKVVNMWENSRGKKEFHGTWLWRGSETVLGETSSSSELFLVDDCQDIEMPYIKAKANVAFKSTPDNWTDLGNISMDSILEESKEETTTFYYQKRYEPESARFEDVSSGDEEVENKYRFCPSCCRITNSQQQSIPFVREKLEESETETFYGLVKYGGEDYRVGSAVYLQAKTFKFTYPLPSQNTKPKQDIDEERFPEYYRKGNDRVKGSNIDTPEPFNIGYILSISSSYKSYLMAGAKGHLKIKVKKMYRPENTHKSESLRARSDINMVYWSDEECIVPFHSIVGKCFLAYADNLDMGVEEWCNGGPNRFYFNQMYISEENEFDDPPDKACSIGAKHSKKNSKVKSKSKKVENQFIEVPPDHPKIKNKLKTLDVFAGCGGLTEGLHKAGLAESKWAIEVDEAAADAYRLNYPNAAVFTGDCNAILKKVINGETVVGVQRLPQKGEVDLLVGGPPCQGFSGMNRFNSRAYSLFKNSLVVSYLSYCDYYRPRFFIMENVRNFVSFKKSLVLKLTLRCLIQMGYQCAFGIMQAGNFGVPQTRRRLIILAAAPGEKLPHYPNPMYTFSKSACNLSVVVDNKKYSPMYRWVESAPYRVTTVRDALSDLPRIKSGYNEEVSNYGSEPTSYFQRKMRENVGENTLTDHICKDLGSLVEARMAHIPTISGSDWRDLPNIIIPLADGTHTNKLKYLYHDAKAGVSSTGALRGVCKCAIRNESCDPDDRQDNTIIPWCLPHTGNRHNNWAGLYGRVEWDGFFSTTITNPEPMGKQGRVLHPDQTRVVSVRECARSQGFPDGFRFYGSIQDKHRQVGNAVPPPLAAAIGLEIIRSVSLKEL